MKVFPSYERHVTVQVKTKRLKVEVKAGSRCGLTVKGEHVMRLLTTTDKEIESGTRMATAFAVSAMKKDHDNVVDRCKAQGKHNH